MQQLKSLFFFTCFLTLMACGTSQQEAAFFNNLPENTSRTFIGPEFWANRLQDWQVANGRVECLVSDYNRNLHVLTRQLKDSTAHMKMKVQVGFVENNDALSKIGWTGYRIGAQGEFDDYRSSAVFGKGIDAGILTSGQLFIGKYGKAELDSINQMVIDEMLESGISLRIKIDPTANGEYSIKLSAYDLKDHLLQEIEKDSYEGTALVGNLALVSDFPRKLPEEGFESSLQIKNTGFDKPSFWYKNWDIQGDKVAVHDAQTFGPILFSQYTLSKGVLNLTAQMAPVGSEDAQTVSLQTQNGESWEIAGEAQIDPLARTATFRIENWNDQQDVSYRLAYDWSATTAEPTAHYFSGTVQKDPVDKEELVVAGFTGNSDLGFPNNELVKHVMAHQPDMLVFTGDQIYEPVGGYGIQTKPLEKAALDYLRKWYIYGWEYKDMLKDRPSIAIPDDHDVYHGNIWGEGGKATQKEGTTKERQDSGGYKMDPEWVNMVQRTQTSHFPAPYDSTPIKQDIGVYYTEMEYGNISFAIIEDRKWKSSPANIFPEEYQVINGWPENQQYNKPEDFRAPEAKLLGERQLTFLEDWVSNWSEQTKMKVLISQTIFNTVATLPDSAVSDVVVPRLRITEKGVYPDNDRPTQDMDSNGWPKHGRDAAVRTIRKGFAFHLAGDQHLASTIQYGVDEWGDGPYAICVPSVSNYFPRRWFPQKGGMNQQPGMPKNLGDFHDGFGNKMTVLAVANPYYTGLEPSKLYDRAAGYGIVKFNTNSREIEIANWARQTDPTAPNTAPYDGWPINIEQQDNYDKEAVAYLPTVEVSGLDVPPVVQIINENSGEMVYTIRAKDNTFSPKVFAKGKYTIKVGASTEDMQTFTGVSSITHAGTETLEVSF